MLLFRNDRNQLEPTRNQRTSAGQLWTEWPLPVDTPPFIIILHKSWGDWPRTTCPGVCVRVAAWKLSFNIIRGSGARPVEWQSWSEPGECREQWAAPEKRRGTFKQKCGKGLFSGRRFRLNIVASPTERWVRKPAFRRELLSALLQI